MSTSAFDRQVFVDTSAYYAVIDHKDADHVLASVTLRRLVNEGRKLTTTNVVRFELHGLLLKRLGRRAALDALVEFRASQAVIRVRPRDEARAEAILTQYDDKDFSFVDALSFAIMERLGLRTAFAFDRHFTQFGWETIPLAE